MSCVNVPEGAANTLDKYTCPNCCRKRRQIYAFPKQPAPLILDPHTPQSSPQVEVELAASDEDPDSLKNLIVSSSLS